MKVLLLTTTTGYQTQSFAEAALRVGLTPVFGSDRCHRLADPWRDGALPLRFHQAGQAVAAVVAFARQEGVAGIVALGDAPVLTAALACRELGLPFHPPEAAAACRDKFLMRQKLGEAGLPVPAVMRLPADGPGEPPPETPFPCVLKPGSLSASRGVIRANDPGEFRAAFRRIAELIRSPEVQAKGEEITGQILVESFIPGKEFALEGIMERDRLHPLALFDKPDPLDGPYFEETIYVTPSRLPQAAQQSILEAMERAAAALGLYHGPVHAEARWNEVGPWVLELAARPIGGLCARALRFQGGIGLEELILRHATGQSVAGTRREDAAAGVMMIPVPQAGVLHSVEGVDAAGAVPGVTEVVITAKSGEKLVPWPEGSSYPGFIFARASRPEEVEAALRTAHRKLRWRVAESLRVVSGG
jgi:biotin carboxylase